MTQHCAVQRKFRESVRLSLSQTHVCPRVPCCEVVCVCACVCVLRGCRSACGGVERTVSTGCGHSRRSARQTGERFTSSPGVVVSLLVIVFLPHLCRHDPRMHLDTDPLCSLCDHQLTTLECLLMCMPV